MKRRNGPMAKNAQPGMFVRGIGWYGRVTRVDVPVGVGVVTIHTEYGHSFQVPATQRLTIES